MSAAAPAFSLFWLSAALLAWPYLLSFILGGLSIGIGICINITSSSRTVVLVVSSPSTGLSVLRGCGRTLGSLGALLALSVAVGDCNVGRGARIGCFGAGVLLDGA